MIRFQEKNIRQIFTVSLFLKGFNSLIEIIGGVLFLFTGSVTTIISFLIHSELVEDPNDFIANKIQHLSPYFSGHTQLFGALYLLSHGIIKVFLVINLLRGKLWAYPATITVLLIFIVYQVYRLIYGYSFILVFLTLFDILIVILTLHEYRLVKKQIFFT
jgi:uncharacterized membrane protein